MRVLSIYILLLLISVCPTFAQQTKVVKDTGGRNYLQNASGMTLYVFDADMKSDIGITCTGTCAKRWPPFLAGASAEALGDWSIMQRVDGSGIQWVYKGRPLYTYVGDKRSGQHNGDRMAGNKWHAAMP